MHLLLMIFHKIVSFVLRFIENQYRFHSSIFNNINAIVPKQITLNSDLAVVADLVQSAENMSVVFV